MKEHMQNPKAENHLFCSGLRCKSRVLYHNIQDINELYEKKRKKRGRISGVIFEFRKHNITHNALKINMFLR